ncbi:hypothetical protein K6U19_12865 [Vibrio fluvialis]|uniref:hypothetical protein n=1 Tax=Vibrio fluvialis TaxID=676 RepID=UPI001EEB072E|nr:hypothetical protein [Vibrio fluvialis]MCG6342120.1 hypothetical protein [Vibrio fluvialis]
MKKFVIPCLGLILLAGCDQAQQSAAEGNSTQNAAPQAGRSTAGDRQCHQRHVQQ